MDAFVRTYPSPPKKMREIKSKLLLLRAYAPTTQRVLTIGIKIPTGIRTIFAKILTENKPHTSMKRLERNSAVKML